VEAILVAFGLAGSVWPLAADAVFFVFEPRAIFAVDLLPQLPIALSWPGVATSGLVWALSSLDVAAHSVYPFGPVTAALVRSD
jgi:hypothetical protein